MAGLSIARTKLRVGSGGLVARTELAGSPDTADYIDITGLNSDADGGGYRIEVDVFSDTGANRIVYLFVNGKTTTSHYNNQTNTANGSTVSANRATGPRIGVATDNSTDHIVAHLTLHPQTLHPRCISQCFRAQSTSVILDYAGFTYNQSDITNITSLRIQLDTGVLGTGTRVRLYRK